MVNLIKTGNTYNIPIRYYEVDSADELSQITEAPVGSVALVTSTGKTYKLNSSGSYAEYTEPGSGSGSGTELPEYTISNAGEVLKIKSDASGLEWGTPSSSLPTPGAAGNVLTSTGSGWESAAPSDNRYFVSGNITNLEPFTVDDIEDDASDIAQAKANGKTVILRLSVSAYGVIVELPLVELIGDDVAYFCGAFTNKDEQNVLAPAFVLVKISNEGVDTAVAFPLPSVSASNNGQVLGVDNGAYALVDATLILTGTVDGSTVTLGGGVTLTEIYNAAEGGKYVALEIALDTGNKTRIPLSSRTLDNGEYEFVFTVAAVVSSKPASLSVKFENDTTGTLVIAMTP